MNRIEQVLAYTQATQATLGIQGGQLWKNTVIPLEAPNSTTIRAEERKRTGNHISGRPVYTTAISSQP